MTGPGTTHENFLGVWPATPPDRGPQGQSLGHAHHEQVMPANRGYAGYYLPLLFQDNYRLRTAAELDAMPETSIVVALDQAGWSRAYCQRARPHYSGVWWEATGSDGVWSSVALADAVDSGTRLFVVYRPDVMPKAAT